MVKSSVLRVRNRSLWWTWGTNCWSYGPQLENGGYIFGKWILLICFFFFKRCEKGSIYQCLDLVAWYPQAFPVDQGFCSFHLKSNFCSSVDQNTQTFSRVMETPNSIFHCHQCRNPDLHRCYFKQISFWETVRALCPYFGWFGCHQRVQL